MALPIDISPNPSLNEIVSSLSARVNKLDDPGFLQELKHIVNYKRAALLYKYITMLKVKEPFMQSFLVSMEKVNADSCTPTPVTGCYIIKSKCQIPAPFRDPAYMLPHYMLDYVGDKSGYRSYSYMEPNYLEFQQYKEYTASEPKWYLSDGYLYIINSDKTDDVRVRGIFADPMANYSCSICDHNGRPCEPESQPYPAPPELINEIVLSILQVELRADLPKDKEVEEDDIDPDVVEQTIDQRQ